MCHQQLSRLDAEWVKIFTAHLLCLKNANAGNFLEAFNQQQILAK